jgi:hypothetical protein
VLVWVVVIDAQLFQEQKKAPTYGLALILIFAIVGSNLAALWEQPLGMG